MSRRPLSAWFLAVTINSLLALNASAAGPSSEQTAELRIGVTHVTPPLKSAEFRVFTEDGFEQDIGRDIAQHLGVTPKFVRIGPDDAPDLLATGAIDIAIDRSQPETLASGEANVIQAGYRSAKTVAMRTDTDISSWNDLSGRTVCVAEADKAGQRLASNFGATLRIERSPALSLMLVRTGECDAALGDEVLLSSLFQQEGWQKFSATLPPVENSALVIETAKPELGDLVKDAVDQLGTAEQWKARRARWARNVSFEVYLEQDAPDCH